MLSIGACKEGRDWIEAGNHADFRMTWKVCPAAEFLCWLLTRTMGLDGVRACVACAKVAVKDEKLVKDTLALCDQVLERKSTDTRTLQILAYEATEAALSNKTKSGPALLSSAYAAYAVHYAVLASQDVDDDAKRKHILKAAQHSSDAASHAQKAVPKTSLAHVVRQTITEDAAFK